jgi:hypothetical protein
MSKGSIGYKRISVVMSYLLAVPFGSFSGFILFMYTFELGKTVKDGDALLAGIILFVGTPLVFFLPRLVYMTVTWIGAGFKEDKA